MIERTIPVDWVTGDEFEAKKPGRLVLESLATACRYLIVFQVDGGSAPAASTAIEFSQLGEAVREPGNFFSHAPLKAIFFNHDFQPFPATPGSMIDNFIRLDHALQVRAPHTGQLRVGYLLPHEDGIHQLDRLELELEEPVGTSQTLASPGGQDYAA